MTAGTKKLLSVLLCVILVIALIPFAFASELSGSGTKDDPYVIADAGDINALSEAVKNGESFSGKYFLQTADITLTADYTAVGTEEYPFGGIYDGGSHTLDGFGIPGNGAPVFGAVKGADVKNIVAYGFFNQGDSNIGAVINFAENSSVTNCKTENCELYCFNDNAGGIVANAVNCNIKNCVSSTEITSYGKNAGGIAGKLSGEISNCENTGAVYSFSAAGGITGEAGGVISSCKNLGDITTESSVCGGITGVTDGTVTNCSNFGDVTGDGNVGGIAGVINGATVANCYSTGTVTSSGTFCGGIAGFINKGTVSNCYNSGSVSSTADYVGGICGHSEADLVACCYSTANVSASGSHAGGIAGRDFGVTENCFSLTKTLFGASYGQTSGDGVLTEEEMKTEESFTGWDFDSDWVMDGQHGYDYPVLRSMNYHTLSLTQIVEPTCTKGGVSEYFCSVCLTSCIMEKTEALGHSNEETSRVEACCLENGTVFYKCSVCGEESEDILPATGHADEDGNNHCDICDAVIDESKVPVKKTLIQKIADFFKKIIDWFRSLFN